MPPPDRLTAASRRPPVASEALRARHLFRSFREQRRSTRPTVVPLRLNKGRPKRGGPTVRRTHKLIPIVVTTVAMSTLAFAGGASAHPTGIHDNCTNLNRQWAHGVGKANAVDRTTGTRVTNFYRNTAAYNAAEGHNGTLDADNDGIACEKR